MSRITKQTKKEIIRKSEQNKKEIKKEAKTTHTQTHI